MGLLHAVGMRVQVIPPNFLVSLVVQELSKHTIDQATNREAQSETSNVLDDSIGYLRYLFQGRAPTCSLLISYHQIFS